MAKLWQELKRELEGETEKIFTCPPDEIKRFHYGIITHSEAGKYALGQYFGHWVHAYACYMVYSGDILASIQRLAQDPNFELKQTKQMFCDISKLGSMNLLTTYGGQKSLGKYIDGMIRVFDTLQTKEEFIDLLNAFQAYTARLYWWFHWYFPWGVGPALCRRLSPEDVNEIVRLSEVPPVEEVIM